MLDLWPSHCRVVLCERLLGNTKCVMFKWGIPDRLTELSKVTPRKIINRIAL